MEEEFQSWHDRHKPTFIMYTMDNILTYFKLYATMRSAPFVFSVWSLTQGWT